MLELEKVAKRYQTKRGSVSALDGVSFSAQAGEFVLVRGPSGGGKTTLLMALGGMMQPTSGRVLVDGTDLYALSGKDRARLRAQKIGFVFQMFHLVPYLNVIENVLLAAGAGGPRDRAQKLLEQLGLDDRTQHHPSELSAGEKQRTAIARAMIGNPKLILADEPTGNLDDDNAREVARHLADFASDGGTVVMVTHGQLIGATADREIKIEAGQLV